jgi:hypothetical protein
MRIVGGLPHQPLYFFTWGSHPSLDTLDTHLPQKMSKQLNTCCEKHLPEGQRVYLFPPILLAPVECCSWNSS